VGLVWVCVCVYECVWVCVCVGDVDSLCVFVRVCVFVFCVCVACDVSRNVFVCSVLHRVAAYGSVLNFAAPWCSALQRVAVADVTLHKAHPHLCNVYICTPLLFPPPPFLTHTNPSNSLHHSHTSLSLSHTHTHSPFAQYTLSLNTMCPTHNNTLQHTATK